MKGMGMTLEKKYGDSAPKSKSEWQSVGQLAAELVAKAKAGGK